MSKTKENTRARNAGKPAEKAETPAEKLEREAAEANAEAGVKPGDAATLEAPAGTEPGPVKDGTPSHPFTLDSPEVAADIAKMVEATEAEAKARDSAEALVTEAAAGAWGILRDTTLHLIATAGHKVAGEALTAYKGRTALVGGRTAARGGQYASDLRRAVKLAEKDIAIPEALTTAGRSAWNEAEVFKAIKATTGRKSHNATTEAAAKAEVKEALAGGENGTTEAAGEAVADAVAAIAAKADPVWNECLTLYGQLHGIFKTEAAGRVKGLLLEVLKKQDHAEQKTG